MYHPHQFDPDTKDSMVKRNPCIIVSNLSIAVARVGMVLGARETTGSIETRTTLRGLWYNNSTNVLSLCVYQVTYYNSSTTDPSTANEQEIKTQAKILYMNQ